ncbi:hypothetical protein [Acuticoccus mangrovi]|uniref:Uncharacterized protein n=1 Tax=Acuticoccus mangrovi TaxID=2796142 RepID=A0A934ITS3_9HYPH|nr:hypothetical protein [Acuticoccus mangrovi]MBJ3777885.1 hypothetical protein [Acuticoccus mangrovi]
MHNAAAEALAPTLKNILAEAPQSAPGAPSLSLGAHSKILELARIAAQVPRDPEPYALVSFLESINAYHFDIDASGGVMIKGKIDGYFGGFIAACGDLATDNDPVRLLVISNQDLIESIELPVLAEGAAILVRGAVRHGEDGALVQSLMAAGLVPLALFDTMLLMNTRSDSRGLLRSIVASLNARHNPGWRRSTIRYLDKGSFPLYISRGPSEYDLDQLEIVQTERSMRKKAPSKIPSM